jgi:hypothetical protein
MPTEFEKRFNDKINDSVLEQKLAEIVSEAASEFPCQSCPSKDECNSYKWFLKWFGTPK